MYSVLIVVNQFCFVLRLVWRQKSQEKGSFANPYSSIAERKDAISKTRPGNPIELYTNHFDIVVSPASVVYRYDVDVSFPKWKRPTRASDKPLISRAFEGNIIISGQFKEGVFSV